MVCSALLLVGVAQGVCGLACGARLAPNMSYVVMLRFLQDTCLEANSIYNLHSLTVLRRYVAPQLVQVIWGLALLGWESFTPQHLHTACQCIPHAYRWCFILLLTRAQRWAVCI